MKKTTKIMITMIASGMIMIFATLGYIASTGTTDEVPDEFETGSSIDIKISGNNKTTQLAPFDEIAIIDNMSSNTDYNLKGSCSVTVDSCLTEPQISYSDDWEHYMSINVVNNRLEVAINFGTDEFMDINVDALSAPITISIPDKVRSITNEALFSNFEINNLDCDNLLLTTKIAKLNNCDIQSMKIPNEYNTYLTLEDTTTIGTVTFDSVKCIGKWICSENSFINTIKAYALTSYEDIDLKDLNYNEFILETTDNPTNINLRTNGAIKITPIKN